jgi:hypothetical protein
MPFSMSPQVQQGMQGPPPAEQAQQMFTERFTQMAYNVLFSRFPELAQNVVTFKLLNTDAENGDGVGAFIVMYEQIPLYIPVVIGDGQLKPIEMFYHKQLNTFLPLDRTWIEEITKMQLMEMGESRNVPETVPRDVSVRNIVLPPATTGRYGYASAPPTEEELHHGVKTMLKAAVDHSLSIHPQFLNVLRSGHKTLLDGVKLAMQQHPSLLQNLAKVYGVTALTSAFQDGYANVKVAAAPKETAAFKLLTAESSPDELKKTFGSRSGAAFAQIMKLGYAAEDTRGDLNRTVKIESSFNLEEPSSSADGEWFRLYFLDAPPEVYYVVPWPKGRPRSPEGCIPSDSATQPHKSPTKYLLIRKDLKNAFVGTSGEIMGERVDPEPSSPVGKLLEKGGDKKSPTTKSYGFFWSLGENGKPQVSDPLYIERVVTENGQSKYYTEYNDLCVVRDDSVVRKKMQYVPGARAMDSKPFLLLPNSATWVDLTVPAESGEEKKSNGYYWQKNHQARTSLIQDPQLMSRWLDAKLQQGGAKVASVRKDGSFWRVENDAVSLPFKKALEKVAKLYRVSVNDAAGILKEAQDKGRTNVRIVRGGNALERYLSYTLKVAQPGMDPSQMQGMDSSMMQGMDPSMMQGMDPSQMQGMDPSQMGGMPQQPQPQSMSPTDLAITEAVQQLTQQGQLQMQQMQSQAEQTQQQLQMQQQQTEQLVTMLQGIQQRAAQIGQAAGGQIPPEAMGAPAAAAEMLSPVPPEEEPTPPMPAMPEDEDGTNPEAVAQQINPELVDQAADLQDQKVFDTAAISMLASSPVLQEIVASYVPNMEKCLDNVGRVLLTLWLTERETQETIGNEAFTVLEDKLRTVFKSLGDSVITLKHTATNKLPDEMAQQGQPMMGR